MDPALGITSPFRNEAAASEGNHDEAIGRITGEAGQMTFWADADAPAEAASSTAALAGAPEVTRGARATPCSLCGERSTTAPLPKDGLYRCPPCVALRTADGRPRVFPAGTFTCCPTAELEGEGGVARCAGCSGWYHLRCVGLGPSEASHALRQHASLSTTKWYCPEPSCCEKVLMRQLKKK